MSSYTHYAYAPVRYLLQDYSPTSPLSWYLSGPVPDVQPCNPRVNVPVSPCRGHGARAGVRAPARVNGATQRLWWAAGPGISCGRRTSQARYAETAGLLAGQSRRNAGPHAFVIRPWMVRGGRPR